LSIENTSSFTVGFPASHVSFQRGNSGKCLLREAGFTSKISTKKIFTDKKHTESCFIPSLGRQMFLFFVFFRFLEKLVGGSNPFEKYARQNGFLFPKIGAKIKTI